MDNRSALSAEYSSTPQKLTWRAYDDAGVKADSCDLPDHGGNNVECVPGPKMRAETTRWCTWACTDQIVADMSSGSVSTIVFSETSVTQSMALLRANELHRCVGGFSSRLRSWCSELRAFALRSPSLTTHPSLAIPSMLHLAYQSTLLAANPSRCRRTKSAPGPSGSR